MSNKGRVKTIVILVLKFLGLLSLLYIFVCSLDVMSSSFRLVGGELYSSRRKKKEICLIVEKVK